MQDDRFNLNNLFPSQGFPGQQPPGPPPSQQPSGFPGAGQSTIDLPPPPATIPEQKTATGPSVMAVDPGSLRGCLYRYTWVRLNNGRSFWFYPTYIGRNSVAGYRWRRRYRRWVYFGIDTRRISSFQC